MENIQSYFALIMKGKVKEARKLLNDSVPNKLYKFSTIGEKDRDKRINTWKSKKIYVPKVACLNDIQECSTLYIKVKDKKANDLWNKFFPNTVCIFSMTANDYQNQLMWAYYTNHEGICFEYEVVDKTKIFPVFYTDKKNDITFLLPILSGKNIDESKKEENKLFKEQVLEYMRTNHLAKHTSWESENEFRYVTVDLSQRNGIEMNLSDIGLKVTKIIAGAKFDFNNNFSILKELGDIYNCPIRILRKQYDSFELEEDRIAGRF
jgi:hypothetical protein